MVEHYQLGLVEESESYNTIHVDNYQDNNNFLNVETYCSMKVGANLSPLVHFLKKDFANTKIKVCKKCSLIYRRKYGHTLESFLARLKVQNKLFVDH